MNIQRSSFLSRALFCALLIGLPCGVHRALAQLPSDSPSAPAHNPSGTAAGGGGLPSNTPAESNGTPPSASGSRLPSAGSQDDRPKQDAVPVANTAPNSQTPSPSQNPIPGNGIEAAGTRPADTMTTATPATPGGSVVLNSEKAPEGGSPTDLTDGGAFPRLLQSEYTDIDGLPFFTLHGKLPYRETHVNSTTMSIFGGALLALAATVTWYQQAWYPDSTKGPFHFQVDWGYAREMDKVGHAFGGWMSSYCSHEAFIASGLSKEDAALWGSIGGLFFQTFMEVQDGFHSNYGFDWSDQAGNIAGAAYFYAQQKIPFLQNFDFKMSIGASGRDSAREASQIRSRLIVDDYDRQNMWLSFRMHNLLPEGLKPYWPKWLQLAVGIGARDVELTGYKAYRTLHISFDYNLKEMLPDLGSFGNWLVQGLNAFHLPAPAIQLHPKVKFLLLYPITL